MAAEPARQGEHLGHPDYQIRRLGPSELASVGELLPSYHDSIAGFTTRTGFEEGPPRVGAGQVV